MDDLYLSPGSVVFMIRLLVLVFPETGSSSCLGVELLGSVDGECDVSSHQKSFFDATPSRCLSSRLFGTPLRNLSMYLKQQQNYFMPFLIHITTTRGSSAQYCLLHVQRNVMEALINLISYLAIKTHTTMLHSQIKELTVMNM